MDDFFNDEESKMGMKELIARFWHRVNHEALHFFDVDEYEDIIDYYLDKRQTKMAKKVLDIGLQQHPASSSLLIRQAKLLFSDTKTEQALKLLSKVEDLDPTNSDVYVTKGFIYSKLHLPKEAIKEYSKALNDYEYQADLFIQIALEYENLFNYDRAIEFYQKYLELEPDQNAILDELNYCYKYAEEYKVDDCIKFYKAYLDKNPYSHSAWYNLGEAYTRKGSYDEAISAYDFCIAIDPEFSAAYSGKGNACNEAGYYQKAIDTYKESLEVTSESFTYYFIGECYEKMEDYINAIEYYRQATQLDSEFSDAWIGLGVAYDGLGDMKSALHYVKKGVSLEPENNEFIATQAIIQQHCGLYDEAAESFTLALSYMPHDHNLWLDFSAMYAEMDEYSTALKVLDQGIDQLPFNPQLQLRKVAYLYMLGKFKEAVSHLQYVLTLDDVNLENLLDYAPFLQDDPTIAEILSDLL